MKKKLLSLILVLALLGTCCFSLVACGEKKPDPTRATDTLVVGYDVFGNKFSPFFAENAYDQDIMKLVSVPLLASDRAGAIVEQGIEGQVIPYNGTDYTYYGLGSLKVTQNQDGSVDYDVTIRSGDKAIKFSDGKPVTIKDVLFSIYAYCDMDYDSSTTFYSLPIAGMNEWRTGLSTEVLEKYEAISAAIVADWADGVTEYAENLIYTEAQWNSLFASLNTGVWEALAADIHSYCQSEGYSSDVAGSIEAWGFTIPDGMTNPTIADYAAIIKAAYEGDFATAAAVEAANGSYDTYVQKVVEVWMANEGKAEMEGKKITSISGITQTGENSLRIHMTEFAANAIYQLTIFIAPLHYYGDEALYNPAEGSYGFTKGDLSGIRSKTAQPLGAGAYKFISFADGIVTLEANENYFLGKPQIKYLKFKEYKADSDKAPALLNGDIDIVVPSITKDLTELVKKANSNGELTGNKVTTTLIDFNGYGYLGINADSVKIGTDKASEESKNYRKAFATLFAAYREFTVNSYYEDRAAVINYPISNCSWAAPQPNDQGYEVAYSKDADGNPIYTADMTEEQKWAAAKAASITFFKAAGFIFDEASKKFTNVPKTTFVIAGADVTDHPSANLAVKSQEVLATMGIDMAIEYLPDIDALLDGVKAGKYNFWVAAWGGSADPDMYQIYHSSNKTDSNRYAIADAELDDLIMLARTSADTTFRKGLYKQALDIILDWGVEVPVYQRKECTLYSTERVDISSLPKDMTPYWGFIQEIENVKVK